MGRNALVAIAIATVMLTAVPAARAESQPWRGRAVAALARFHALDDGRLNAHAYAYAAWATAILRSWSEPDVARLLDAARALRNPDGGYGLSAAEDAFRDGSINPPDTSYAVTVANHVGRVLLAAAEAGVVDPEEVRDLVRWTLSTARVPGGPGVCVAYSPLERDATRCVVNVNASAGAFLWHARRIGIVEPGQDELIAAIAQRDAAIYDAASGWWPYIEGEERPNDYNHNASNVEAELVLEPRLGREALARMRDRRDFRRWTDPLALVRLLPYDCRGHRDLLPAYDAMVADERADDGRLQAQFAVWSARAAEHCEAARHAARVR